MACSSSPGLHKTWPGGSMPSSSRFMCCLAVVLFSTAVAFGQSVSTIPNSHPTYLQLPNLNLGSEAVSVNNLTLRRAAATFLLNSGNVCFVTAVQDKNT